MAVPQFRRGGVHPTEWSDKRLHILRAAGPRGQCMDRHERWTRSIPTESRRLGPPLSQFRIAVLCRSQSLHSFTTSALVAGDHGAVWAAGMGPKVLLKIQNDRIVTQLRDRMVDAPIVIRKALSGSRRRGLRSALPTNVWMRLVRSNERSLTRTMALCLQGRD